MQLRKIRLSYYIELDRTGRNRKNTIFQNGNASLFRFYDFTHENEGDGNRVEFGFRPNRDNNGPSNGDSVNRSTTPYGPVRSPRWKPPFRSSISPLSTPCPIHPVYRSLLGERVGERWMQLRCWLRAPFLQDTC